MPIAFESVPSGSTGSEVAIGQDGGDLVRRSVLPGGVRVLTERMPGQRSAAIGAWIGVGSRDEAIGRFGSTHFLEHLLFKGTGRRTALDIAESFDAVGGEANAATGKEHTCYYARILDADLSMAADVILDMVTSAVLDTDALETERGVILEELAMNDDDPTDVVHERFAELVYGAHPLGRPIGGTAESITAVPREAVWEHYRQQYRPDTLVVTAAGGVDHDELCRWVLAALEQGGWSLDPAGRPAPRRQVAGSGPSMTRTGSPARTVARPSEQANVVLGCPGLVASDGRRFVLSVLSTILGGGMSSRLFQEIREKRGLAYSVYAFGSGYSDAGSFGLYAGCAPAKADQVVALLAEEWDRLANDGVTEAELRRAVGQMRGSLVLGLEDSGSRMSRLGRAELDFGEFLGLTETLNRIEAVTTEDVRELAAELAGRPRSLSLVGPFDEQRGEDLLHRVDAGR